MKKIVILALHLSTGGIEKSIATLSNILIKKYDVEIISNYQIEQNPAFDIDKKVKITYLMPNLKPNHKEFKDAVKKMNLFQILKQGIVAIKILYLRRNLMIKKVKNIKCDVILSTRYIHNRLIGKYVNNNIIKIAQEHNNNGNKRYIKKVVKSLKNIDYFMPVSQMLTDMYKEKLLNTKTKCVYIHHALKTYTNEISKLDKKNIVSIGRLSSEKGYLDLIDVYEIVNKIKPDWHLNIAGDGEQKEKIEKKICEKNLENAITLLGFIKEDEINKLLLKSSIYVMTSINECFPLVLIEAQSYGLPLIAFDSAEGTKEIIKENENGYLVQNRDKEQMAKRICELIDNIDLRYKMGQISRIESEKFKMENVEKIWYEFIGEITKPDNSI